MRTSELRRRQSDLWNKKQDILFTIFGRLGRPSDQAVQITTRPGYDYVRIGSDERIMSVLNKKTQHRYNLEVLVGYDGLTDEFQVLESRQKEWTRAGYTRIPDVEPHRLTHEWPDPDDEDRDGSDLVYVHHRQIRGCRVSVDSSSGSYYIQCDTGIFRTTSGWAECVSQSLDLSGYRTYAGAWWMLVYLTDAGVLSARQGDIKTIGTIAVTDIPNEAVDEYSLAAVLMWSTQTSLRDDVDRQDILDLRLLQSTGGSAAHNIVSSMHLDTTGAPAEGDVLTYASGVWSPKPPASGGSVGTAEAPIGPRWHVDGPLAVIDEVDGIWILTSDWRIETAYLYLYDAGDSDSTIVSIDKSDDDGASWTQIITVTLAHNGGHVATGAPASPQMMEAGILLRANIDQIAPGARGASIAVSGLFTGSGVLTGVLLPIMGAG
jgi:hypothetical protein